MKLPFEHHVTAVKRKMHPYLGWYIALVVTAELVVQIAWSH